MVGKFLHNRLIINSDISMYIPRIKLIAFISERNVQVSLTALRLRDFLDYFNKGECVYQYVNSCTKDM